MLCYNTAMSICSAVKNHQSIFISCNEDAACLAGLDSPRQIVGKSDSDLSWSADALAYQRSDQIILSGKPYLNKIEY